MQLASNDLLSITDILAAELSLATTMTTRKLFCNIIRLQFVDYSTACMNLIDFITFFAHISDVKWRVSLSVEVNENINLGYSQDQGYS